MRVTILSYAIILTKAHRAVVSIIAKAYIVAVLCLRYFLFLLPNYINCSVYFSISLCFPSFSAWAWVT